MNVAVVRYGEIGTKSGQVKIKMISKLRQRIEDCLKNEEINFNKVSDQYGRIIVETNKPRQAAKFISKMPGVSSTSPAYKIITGIENIKEATNRLKIGETFAVRTNTSRESDLGSQEVNIKTGSHIEEVHGSKVDLDSPDTKVEVDIQSETSYVFTERFEGPDGYPVDSKDSYAALISGGIDSPVAAYRMMTRGADIIPVYFYNKPIASEDHLIRFKAVVNKLKKFHPSKNWFFYKIDMENINKRLMNVERGRMILHRKIMFKLSEKIVEEENLQGIVTGESLGQKSSQTPQNMKLTSQEINETIFRPLITEDKNSITQKAREINTFEEAKIDSACKSLSPQNPAASMKKTDLERLEDSLDIDSLIDEAWENTERTWF